MAAIWSVRSSAVLVQEQTEAEHRGGVRWHSGLQSRTTHGQRCRFVPNPEPGCPNKCPGIAFLFRRLSKLLSAHAAVACRNG